MPQQQSPRERAEAFCRHFGLRVPILQAPMAGACPVGLAAAVANAGGMGGFGALTTPPNGIAGWAEQLRGCRAVLLGAISLAIPFKASGVRFRPAPPIKASLSAAPMKLEYKLAVCWGNAGNA